MDGTRVVQSPGIDPTKPELRKIKFIDEDINHPNWIVLVDPVLQAFGKQCRLPALHSIDKALHSIPRESAGESYSLTWAFSHNQGH